MKIYSKFLLFNRYFKIFNFFKYLIYYIFVVIIIMLIIINYIKLNLLYFVRINFKIDFEDFFNYKFIRY